MQRTIGEQVDILWMEINTHHVDLLNLDLRLALRYTRFGVTEINPWS